MSKRPSIALILAVVLLVVAGVGTHAVVNRLSDQAVWVLVGGVGVLVVVLTVGMLFVVKDLAQAYVMRRMLAQDNLNDLRQTAMMARLMGEIRTPNVNLRLPQRQAQPWSVALPRQPASPEQPFSSVGDYRDTVFGDEVELE